MTEKINTPLTPKVQAEVKEEKFIPMMEDRAGGMKAEDILAQYVPEEEFQFKGSGKTPYQNFLEKYMFEKKDKGWIYKDPKDLAIMGTVLATKMIEGKQILYKVKITSATDYQTFLRQAEANDKKLRETTFFGPGSYNFDPFANDSDTGTGTIAIANGDVEYTPIMGGPFCFTGDTEIKLLNGKSITIKELANNYKDKTFWVYSIDGNGEIKPGLAHSPRKTGNKTEVIQVELDNGEKIKCTSNHLFMMRDGTYRKAIELKENDSLMPLYTKISNKGLEGYELVFNPAKNKYQYTHMVVVGKVSKGYIRHHKDFNKRNNEPDNFEIMKRLDHQIYHMNNCSWWNDLEKKRLVSKKISKKLKGNHNAKNRSEEMTKRFAKGWQVWNKGKKNWMSDEQKEKVRNSQERKEAIAKSNSERIWTSAMRLKTAESVRQLHNNPEYKAKTIEALNRGRETRWDKKLIINHKVKSVSFYGYEDVYDFTVEKYHNFGLSSGVFVHNSKQLYLFDYLSMHAKAFEMWNHNPVAHQIIKITTYFVLGRGFKVKFKNAKAQTHFDKFCEKNDFYNRIKVWCDQESRDGELMVRIYKDPMGETGDVLVRAIDPSTIWEIVTDPEDIEKVYYYHQQYQTMYQVFYAQNMINLPSIEYVIHQIPPNEVLHYKLNCNSNEKRGRSDLFPVMTWLKRLKDFYTARVIRAIMQSCVVWKNVVKGDAADINALKAQYGITPPKAGTVHWENESSTLSSMTVDIKAADAKDDGDALLNLISVGVGIPKEYLGLGDRSTRATALVASEPGAKKFQDRQEHYKKIITDVATIVTKEGMKANVIPSTEKIMPDNVIKKIIHATKSGDYMTAIKLLWSTVTGGEVIGIDSTFEVIMPEIILEDRSQKIKDLTMMQVNEWISKETAAVIAAKEMHIETYDYPEEKVKIDKDTAQGNPYGQYEPMMSPAGGGVKYKALDNPKDQTGAPAGGLSGNERNQIKKDNKQAEAAIKESAAAKLPDSEFDPAQLTNGTKIEMEHTDDPEVAKAIAKDHLAEYPDYYIELAKMEKKLKDKEKK